MHPQAVLLGVVRRERKVGKALEALVGCAVDVDRASLTRLSGRIDTKLRLMSLRWAVAGLMTLTLGCGCGSSRSGVGTADARVNQELRRGVEEIRSIHDRKKLDAELSSIVARLRRERGSTAAVERARKAALAGFELTRKGVGSQIDFIENDSGEVAAATRDARRADEYLRRGAILIRMAGLALGTQVGDLDGY
jgi:hypothetical protein